MVPRVTGSEPHDRDPSGRPPGGRNRPEPRFYHPRLPAEGQGPDLDPDRYRPPGRARGDREVPGTSQDRADLHQEDPTDPPAPRPHGVTQADGEPDPRPDLCPLDRGRLHRGRPAVRRPGLPARRAVHRRRDLQGRGHDRRRRRTDRLPHARPYSRSHLVLSGGTQAPLLGRPFLCRRGKGVAHARRVQLSRPDGPHLGPAHEPALGGLADELPWRTGAPERRKGDAGVHPGSVVSALAFGPARPSAPGRERQWDWPDLNWRLGVPNPEGWTKLPHSPRQGSATSPRYLSARATGVPERRFGVFRDLPPKIFKARCLSSERHDLAVDRIAAPGRRVHGFALLEHPRSPRGPDDVRSVPVRPAALRQAGLPDPRQVPRVRANAAPRGRPRPIGELPAGSVRGPVWVPQGLLRTPAEPGAWFDGTPR